jgi:hypothetical protein
VSARALRFCERGVKYSEDSQKLIIEETRSDLRNNERDNLKTRNNYNLPVQEVALCKKINQR